MSRAGGLVVAALVALLTVWAMSAALAEGPSRSSGSADEAGGRGPPSEEVPPHAGPAVAGSACPTPGGHLLAMGERPHPPIRVDGNEPHRGFTIDADAPAAGGGPVYRPGSGVVAGNGTAGNPYLVGGWSTTHIVVENTSAHVRIQGNSIRVPGPQARVTGFGAPTAPEEVREPLVFVRNASNVTVADNLVDRRHRNLRRGHDVGFVEDTIRVEDSRDVAVVGNRLLRDDKPVVESAGTYPVPLRVVGSRDVCLQANSVDVHPETWRGAVRVEESRDVVVRDHNLTPTRVTLEDSWRVRLVDNVLGPTWLRSSPHTVLRGNEIQAPPNAALALEGTSPRAWDHTIPPGNSVNGEPLRYVSGEENVTVGEPANQVVVHNATNVSVRDVELLGPLMVGFSQEVSIHNGTLEDVFQEDNIDRLRKEALWGRNVSGLRLEDSRVVLSRVEVVRSEDVRLVNTTMDRSFFSARHSDGVRLHELEFPWMASHCAEFIATNHVRVTQSRCEYRNASSESVVTAFQVARTELDGPVPHDFTLRNNTIDAGFYAFEAHNGQARNVTLIDNDILDGKVSMAYPAEIHGNNLWQGAISDDVDKGDGPTDARRNWWGCPEGPKADDGCGRIWGEVRVDPPLSSPNPEAGVD